MNIDRTAFLTEFGIWNEYLGKLNLSNPVERPKFSWGFEQAIEFIRSGNTVTLVNGTERISTVVYKQSIGAFVECFLDDCAVADENNILA